MRAATCALLALLLAGAARAADGKVAVVTAENIYGDIAAQIGGAHVAVTSLISNPAQDPHLFEASPTAVRAIAGARVVILNGAGYDPWMEKLLGAAPNPQRAVVSAAAIMDRKAGDNPHLWYDPATMPRVATAIAAALTAADPAHAAGYAANLTTVNAALTRIDARAAGLRTKYKDVPVTATEPVFGPMAQAIGLAMRNERFQRAVMNGTEPTAHDLAEIERDLKERRVRALIDNAQVSDLLTARLRALAAAARIPVVPVTETLPAGLHFQDWVLSELDALDKALGGE
ncbi:MAG TPA: zinc ABC transporter substrate-binding protein [Pseudolabrys sp.]|jgi:zinc/manganese transport system substrate-binding protein|nr:zinc ABC transporter substrate-binding protein [Pseudolabrys sp.]